MKNLVLLVLVLCFAVPVWAQEQTTRYQEMLVIERGPIYGVHVSPQQSLVALTTLAGIWIYDLSFGDFAHFQAGDNAHITTLNWGADDRLLATGDQAGNVNVWDVQAQALLASFQLPADDERVRDLAFSPDHTRLVGASTNGMIYVWHIPTGVLAQSIQTDGDDIARISWNRSGTQVASLLKTGEDWRLLLWDTRDWAVSETADLQTFADIEWHPSQPLLLLKHSDRLAIFDTVTGSLVKEFSFDQPIRHVSWHEDGSFIVGIEEDTGAVWSLDYQSGERHRAFSYTPTLELFLEALLYASQQVLVSEYDPAYQYRATVALVDLETGDTLARLDKHYTDIQDIGWSPDGTHIGTTHEGGRVLVWEAKTGELAFSLDTDLTGPTIEWGADYIAIVGRGRQKILILDGRDYSLVHAFDNAGSAASWHTGNSLLAVADSQGISVYSTPTWSREYTLEVCSGQRVMDTAWSHSGRQLAVHCGELIIYDVIDNSVKLKTIVSGNAVAWSPDDARILVFSKRIHLDQAAIIDIATAEPLTIGVSQTDMDWQPNGQLIAGVYHHQNVFSIVLQDSETSEIVDIVAEQPETDFTNLQWSPDGVRILASDSAYRIRIWAPQ